MSQDKGPEAMIVAFSDLRLALARGLADFRRAPLHGMAMAAVFVAAGWLLVWAVAMKGQIWAILPASAGFPLVGPFLAVGFYEMSRRMDIGQSLDWASVLDAIWAQRRTQIPSMAAVIMVFFLFWNTIAHMLFALFIGNAQILGGSGLAVLLGSAEGLAMLGLGTIIGAAIAMLLFAMTVVSLPLLMDREVDFVTAMLCSIALVRQSPLVMAGWGLAISALLFAAILPGFLGLVVVLPVLGHASWHLYRSAVRWTD